MESRLLRSFATLADELHYGRAAQRLFITQSALSKQVQQLEAGVGSALFVRDRRAVRLTALGALLLEPATHAIAQLDRVGAIAEQWLRGETGRLQLGFVPTAPYNRLPEIVQAFRRAHPGIDCMLREASSGEQLHAIQTGGLDVGMLRPPLGSRPAALSLLTVVDEPFVVMVPRGHRLQRRQAVALADCADEPFVMVSRSTAAGTHDQVVLACRHAGFSPRVVQEGSQAHTVAAMVASGAGVGLLPVSCAEMYGRELVWRPLKDTRLRSVLALAWSSTNRSPALRRFLVSARRTLAATE